MINMDKKIRTVKVNERGQIVIPEEIREDLGIKESSVLVIIEENNGIIIKKESELLKEIDEEDKFWRRLSKESMKRVWNKEDKIWDKIYKDL